VGTEGGWERKRKEGGKGERRKEKEVTTVFSHSQKVRELCGKLFDIVGRGGAL